MTTITKLDTEKRQTVKGLAALPLATLLADPALAEAVAAELDTVTITTPGGRAVTASLAMPDVTPAPVMMCIHEWWGLTDEVRTIAAAYAKEGYIALAIDLYEGQVGTTAPEAAKLAGALQKEEEKANDIVTAWAEWLRSHPQSTGKLGTVGWCMGGKWSLNTSILTPVDATVVYYGNVARTAEDLASLKGDVLGHFGTLDRFINKQMVDGFEAAMADAGKNLTVHWYDADHAFSNPSGSAYDQEDAELAWERTQAFFRERLI